ncbi:MAG: hypothetical protein U0133_06085 [Gemmatimonadales bacterium]
MRGVPSLFRRGGLAILTGFLTVICMLPTGPINALVARRPGGVRPAPASSAACWCAPGPPPGRAG